MKRKLDYFYRINSMREAKCMRYICIEYSKIYATLCNKHMIQSFIISFEYFHKHICLNKFKKIDTIFPFLTKH